jgi:cytochrome c
MLLWLTVWSCSRSPGPEGSPAAVEAETRLGLGRAATAEEIAAWDLDVDTRGKGLPPGAGHVTAGASLFIARCAACHGLAGEGGTAPRLVGTEPTTGFGDDPRLPKTIGNFWPYATTLYDYVGRTMPQTAPGSLTPDETYALAAWLLHVNGAVPADFVADAHTLPAVKMPTRLTFVADDRESTSEFR